LGIGRPLRKEYAGALYQITNRRNERRKIFLEDVDRKSSNSVDDLDSHFYGLLPKSYFGVLI
jgi:hypothetical protein